MPIEGGGGCSVAAMGSRREREMTAVLLHLTKRRGHGRERARNPPCWVLGAGWDG